jgi:hypothetical protein
MTAVKRKLAEPFISGRVAKRTPSCKLGPIVLWCNALSRGHAVVRLSGKAYLLFADRSTSGHACRFVVRKILSSYNFSPSFRNLDSRKRYKLLKLREFVRRKAPRHMHSGLTVVCGCWRVRVSPCGRSVVARRRKGFTTLEPPGRSESGWDGYVSARRRCSKPVHWRDRMSFTITIVHIVDDDEAFRLALARLLRAAGYHAEL